MSSVVNLLAAIQDFVAEERDRKAGSSHAHRWQVLHADRDGFCFELQLTFLPDQTYCCFEPGCHLGLHGAESWQRLRRLCSLHGLDLPSRPGVIRLVGIVSAGARCRETGRSGGFGYVETFTESDAQ